MKIIILIVLIINLTLISYCQELQSVNNPELKIAFSIKAGFIYKNYFGNRYIEHPVNNSNQWKKHQFDGFTKIPSAGFQGGGLMNCRIVKQFYFTTGILFSFRKDIYEGDHDTILKYGRVASSHYIEKYDYSYYNLEIPVLLLYRLKKADIFVGIDLPLLSFRTAKYTYIPEPDNDLTGKKVNELELFKTIFPTIQMSYQCEVGKVLFKPFLGIEFGIKKSFSVQGGIIFPVQKYLHHKSKK
jgi:hypothetical protein